MSHSAALTELYVTPTTPKKLVALNYHARLHRSFRSSLSNPVRKNQEAVDKNLTSDWYVSTNRVVAFSLTVSKFLFLTKTDERETKQRRSKSVKTLTPCLNENRQRGRFLALGRMAPAIDLAFLTDAIRVADSYTLHTERTLHFEPSRFGCTV